MNVKIYINPEYKNTLWVNQSLKAMSLEIMRKRYTPEFIDSADISELDFDRIYEGEEKRLLIYVGSSVALTPAVLARFTACGVHVIFLNFESASLSNKYSRILLDYRDGMRKMINYLVANDHDGIALYGINPNSATDTIKESFFADYLRRHGGNPSRDIYYNYASLSGCFARFFENHKNYNSVICANDIAALSLISHLKQRGVRVPEDLFVASFGSTVLASLSSPTITSVTVDHAELGRQAVLAYSYLYKNPGDISLTVTVDAKLVVRDSTDRADKTAPDIFADFFPELPNVNFYDDPIVQRVFDAESLLDGCDELDYGILEGILHGETYPSIAERLYTSENVISYRIKRMCKVTGCTKKSELIALLSPYFQ